LLSITASDLFLLRKTKRYAGQRYTFLFWLFASEYTHPITGISKSCGSSIAGNHVIDMLGHRRKSKNPHGEEDKSGEELYHS